MWEIEWELEATNGVAVYLDDPGLADVLATLDGLSEDPYAKPAFEMGNRNSRRIHVGLYRLIVEIDPEAGVVHFVSLQRGLR